MATDLTMNLGVWFGLTLGALGLIWITVDTIRERRKLRRIALQRLQEPGSSTFAAADTIARRLALRTGIPHHENLTNCRWIVVAMEEGE